ncbi:solute carrier family 7 member 14 [Dermatophagoides farinae]|uniref:solute carrier family 7 member 14 n=1 Tax=Dermatophagoides farinae TaxID=6954 RepID=UPI003F635E39
MRELIINLTNRTLTKIDPGKWMMMMSKLLRTREPDSTATDQQQTATKLEKCLKTRDLVSLGVGSCVGTGMYIVAGMVAKNLAGPAVIISFLIAGIASLLSGVCYAEFGVRVPNTSGSAYMYSYVTVGEFIAFVIGWNMILEYLIGSAAGAAAISACIDSMYNGHITLWIRSKFGTFIGHTPDIFAAIITIIMTLILATGVKKSLMFTNILNAINFSIWFFIIASSLFYLDFDNWSETITTTTNDHHHNHQRGVIGGFAPYGWSGILNGAATCFYAFIGFDIIATTGEESENPQRSIPTAIVTSMIIALIAYISSGLIVTLVIPYWQIDTNSPIIEMFADVGANRCKFFAAIGALAGLFVSMFGSMFPMPRVVYAMAKDGLLYQEFAQISPFTNTPVKSTLIFGSFTAFIALIMSLEVLVEMMSIGTLMAYTLVSTCVLLLRYQPTKTNLIELLPQSIRSACVTPNKEIPPSFVQQQHYPPPPSFVCPSTTTTTATITSMNQMSRQQCYSKKIYESSDSGGGDDYDPNWSRQGSKDDEFLVPGTAGLQYGSVPYQHGGSSSRRYGILDKYEKLLMYLFPYGWQVNTPATEESGMYVARLVGIFLLLVLIFDIQLAWHINSINWNNNRLLFLLFMVLFISIIVIILAISRQPQIRCNLKFKAPGVPFVPAIAIIINIYLILRLSILTLVRFIIWMTIGLFIYFGYGINHSILEQQEQQQLELKIPANRLAQTFNKNNLIINPPIKSTTTTTSSSSSFTRTDSISQKPPIPPRPKNRPQPTLKHQQSSTTKWETFD